MKYEKLKKKGVKQVNRKLIVIIYFFSFGYNRLVEHESINRSVYKSINQ